MKKLTLALAIAGVMASSAGQAAVSNNNLLTHGVYLGGSISGTSFGKTYVNGDTLGPRFSNSSPSGRVFTGYQITDLWGVELGYDWLNQESQKNGSITEVDRYIHGPDITVKISKPFNNGITLYSRAGIAILNNKNFDTVPTPNININETDVTPLIAAGVNYNFTKSFALGLETSYFVSVNHLPHIFTYGLRVSYTI